MDTPADARPRAPEMAVEVGLVSASRDLADFYADVFGLEEQPVRDVGEGLLHRVEGHGLVIKVMVPTVPPATPPPAAQHWHVAGFRYLGVVVDDLDAVLARAAARGTTPSFGPQVLPTGDRVAMVADPDGNSIELKELATRASPARGS